MASECLGPTHPLQKRISRDCSGSCRYPLIGAWLLLNTLVRKSQVSKCSPCGARGTALSGDQTSLGFLLLWMLNGCSLRCEEKGRGFSLLSCSPFPFVLSPSLFHITSMAAVCKFISSLRCHHMKLSPGSISTASVCAMQLSQPRLSSITVSSTTEELEEEDLDRNPKLSKGFFHCFWAIENLKIDVMGTRQCLVLFPCPAEMQPLHSWLSWCLEVCH